MCGLMCSDAGCTWKASSLAVPTSSICCPTRLSDSTGNKTLVEDTYTHMYTHMYTQSQSRRLLLIPVSCIIVLIYSISTEFLALMKKVAKSPLVMDVVNIPGILKSLERLADLLAKIQKALGEYLERERASFPR